MLESVWQQRTVYIPYMSDHSYILAAAFRYQGISAEVLPPSSYETLEVGLKLCRGRECLPCFTTTGDFMNLAQQPDFKAAEAALFMPITLGPCRFGQYATFQRDILDQNGLMNVEILSPAPHNAYRGFGGQPTQLRQIAWQGFVAVDLLQSLLYEHRPYEASKGQSDRIYTDSLQDIVSSVEKGGKRQLVETMGEIARKFEQVVTGLRSSRPLVGMIGELYLRNNPFSNEQLTRYVEDAGCEIFIANITEWVYFLNWNSRQMYIARKNFRAYLEASVNNIYQRYWENKLYKPVAHLLRHEYKVSIGQTVLEMKPYYQPAIGLETESVMTLGNAIDFARTKKCSGILHLMPFACIGGTIVSGMIGQLREHLNTIPWLDVVYDTHGISTNLNTRLEAFVHQVAQYHERNFSSEVNAG